MNIAISKWGNSIGIRIPVVVTETLGLQAGDQVSCELKDGGMFMRKQQSTSKCSNSSMESRFQKSHKMILALPKKSNGATTLEVKYFDFQQG